MKKTYHVTLRGTPLCQHPQLLHIFGISPYCEYKSKALAEDAINRITAQGNCPYHKEAFAVVSGPCPIMATEELSQADRLTLLDAEYHCYTAGGASAYSSIRDDIHMASLARLKTAGLLTYGDIPKTNKETDLLRLYNRKTPRLWYKLTERGWAKAHELRREKAARLAATNDFIPK